MSVDLISILILIKTYCLVALPLFLVSTALLFLDIVLLICLSICVSFLSILVKVIMVFLYPLFCSVLICAATNMPFLEVIVSLRPVDGLRLQGYRHIGSSCPPHLPHQTQHTTESFFPSYLDLLDRGSSVKQTHGCKLAMTMLPAR